MRKLATLMLLMTLLVLSSACNRQPLPLAAFSDDGDYLPPAVGPGLVARDHSPIPDVPLPIGFTAVPSRSEAVVDGQVRHVKHVYQGRSSVAEAVNFYRRHLPRQHWLTEGRERDIDGTTVMHFTKGRESLRLRMAERHNVVTVVVTIGPRM